MKQFFKVLEKIITVICGILMAVMVIVIAYQVLLRYVFHDANAWSEEMARYCMLVIVMLTAPIGLKRGRHVRVDFFVNMLPAKVQAFLDLLMDLLMVVYMVGLIMSAKVLMSNPSKQFTPGLHIDMMYMYGFIALGGVLMLLFMADTIYEKYIVPAKEKKADGKENK